MAALGQATYAAVDVHYPPEGGARAALVTAWEPRFARIAATTRTRPSVPAGVVATIVRTARVQFVSAVRGCCCRWL